jgi:hypothetical protein
MKLKIDLKESSTPLEFNDVKNSYTKGPLFCIYTNASVTKIPIQNIWRIVEDYVSANTAEVKEAWDKVTDKPDTLMKRFGSGGDLGQYPDRDLYPWAEKTDKLNSLIDFVNWEEISETPLSENFIREFQDYVVWDYVSGNSPLSENFIREFQDKVDWNVVSMDQVLSESFIREFQDRVDWICIFTYQVLSEEFRKYHEDRL